MSESINFGKPIGGVPLSFEESLRKLSKPGIASGFNCYFPEQLAFEAFVKGIYDGWREDAPTFRVRVLGFRASYVTMEKSGLRVSFEARYAIVKKTGKTAKNRYLACFGPYANKARVSLASEREHLSQLINTSPFQPHIENNQLYVAKMLAKHYKGEISKTPIHIDGEFKRNKFLEEEFRLVRVQRMENKERAQQKVLEAAQIHYTEFHGDLNAKFDGLIGGPEKVRRDALENQAAMAAGFPTAKDPGYLAHSARVAEEDAQRNREAALQELVQAWSDRMESQRRTLAKF